MVFVNEYVSDENILKYDLAGVRKKWFCDIPPRFQYVWTFDRERDCYFIPLRSGREEFANRTHCVLYFKGRHWDVEILKEPRGSQSATESPYRIIWGLVGIKNSQGESVPREEIIPVLKEALTTYGYRGVHDQIDNSHVKFTF